MRASDAQAIARLHAESWRDAYRGMLSEAYLREPVLADKRALWRERLANPRPEHVGLIAEDANLVGFVFAVKQADGTLLDNFHVHPARRGHGVGRKLLHALSERIEGGVFLWVYDRNLRARALYERLGGEAIESAEEEAPGGGSVLAVRYAWRDVRALRGATS